MIKFFKIISKYSFLIKYFVISFYIGSLALIFFLLSIKEISSLLFLVFFIIINISLLLIYFLKIRGIIDRTDFLNLILSLNVQKKLVGVEVGVLNGDYSEKILNFFNKKFDFYFYLIDPWKGFNDYDQKFLDICYSNVKRKFSNNKKITILRQTSRLASSNFDDESLDFVYIDANHEYKYISEDLELWFPKLKSHGVLFGDDYSRNYGVHKAVNEFSFKKKLVVKFSDDFKQYCFIKS